MSGAEDPTQRLLKGLLPFKSRYLQIDRLRVHYFDEGSGDTVLMLHGNPTWGMYYRQLISGLSDRWRTIAPDHIGFGHSDKPPASQYEYTLARRVSDLERFVNALDLSRVTLVLHDWGGMIGMAWAARNPERVERLVVLNTAAFLPPVGARLPWALRLARTPLLGKLLVQGTDLYVRGALHFGVRNRPLAPEIARSYREPLSSRKNRVGVYRFLRDLPVHPSHRTHALVAETDAALHRLRDRPTLICWGLDDFVLNQYWLAEWCARFPAARVHRFPEAGHFVLEDAADSIVSLTRAFLLETTM